MGAADERCQAILFGITFSGNTCSFEGRLKVRTRHPPELPAREQRRLLKKSIIHPARQEVTIPTEKMISMLFSFFLFLQLISEEEKKNEYHKVIYSRLLSRGSHGNAAITCTPEYKGKSAV